MNAPAEIFIVDDEPGLRSMIEDYLGMQGFKVSGAESGAELDLLMTLKTPDLILLDINMPGESGLSIVRRLRGTAERMGVIMLTANADETSKLVALGHGADDYLIKPFEVRELLARVRSVLRRVPPRPLEAQRPRRSLSLGRFRLDLEGKRLLDAAGEDIEISSMEYELLEAFARHPHQVLTRERLCELAHGRPLGEADRSVDIRIARLRKKLEADPSKPELFKTIRGEGYMFEPIPGCN
ncbi:response regulator [Chelatococcus asaccharovorans]|uniref:Regulatory protein VirG n=1 Tax=Chelatococcus asaccharovorans TaxID=28210 RepID=A0A2V3UDU7_9HYPH|nr:response regulator [Chelatococcus asaccharovorans]MBS7707004.1 response regulator [Chelatococcus asaccharovorans]PXW63184.1 two-component system phosphate regulon response regulator OmpR [Chelatococcus asaccharovorans]CAH1653389.1 DNA-binding transcriptional dual regulator OmpR [Chelatococcus asaccharovorans]CAH1694094.1 DNA-binding transcriptional dual regulator OmpR [Chelatococcus asaccharovorans]